MNLSFKKQIENLEPEVLLKSIELDDDDDNFQFELDIFNTEKEIIAVSPKCVRYIFLMIHFLKVILNLPIFLD